MPASIKIRGGRETAKALELLGRRSAQEKVLRASLRPGARNYVLLARRNAPVESGLYRRSIAVGIMRTRRAGARLVVGIRGVRAKISHILEFGSRYVAARPHMRPAAQSGSSEAVRLFGQTVWAQIRQEATRLAVRKAIRGR